MTQPQSKRLVYKLCRNVCARLGYLWNQMNEEAEMWRAETLAEDGDQGQQGFRNRFMTLVEFFFFKMQQYWTLTNVSWNASNRPHSAENNILNYFIML